MTVGNRTWDQRQGSEVNKLTDSTGATPIGTLADVSTAVTGSDGVGNTAALKTDVDARLVAINLNFAEVNAKLDALADLLNKRSP